MDQLEMLAFAVDQLEATVGSLDDSDMGTVTNCEPWTVRQLASHALNNQLLWAGVVTDQATVSVEDTMGAVPLPGDLAPVAADIAQRVAAMRGTPGVLEATHATPFGELPGSAIVYFPVIDAVVHAWDLSASLGRAVEFAPEDIPMIATVVDLTCTEGVRAMGLIKPATAPPADATDTERLMALAGRTIARRS